MNTTNEKTLSTNYCPIQLFVIIFEIISDLITALSWMPANFLCLQGFLFEGIGPRKIRDLVSPPHT